MATCLHPDFGTMEERRRSPRRTVDGFATIPSTLSVQLLDISTAGVLLQASEPVDQGIEGCLSLSLHGLPLKADVHVQRVTATEPATGCRVGATFVDLSPDQRQLVERFMAQ